MAGANTTIYINGVNLAYPESKAFIEYLRTTIGYFKDGTIKIIETIEEVPYPNTDWTTPQVTGIDGKKYWFYCDGNFIRSDKVYSVVVPPPEPIILMAPPYTTYYPRIAKECANVYREKTGETELVKAQELPTLIENMRAPELPNGKVWKQSNITSGNFTAVAYGKGIYVATGDNGIYWSEDGKTWAQSNVTGRLQNDALIYANGIFVAAGSITHYSVDGKTWNRSSGADGMIERISHLTYGKGLFIACDEYGKLLYSTDGETWNASGISNYNIDCLAYGNGIFVAGGTSPLEAFSSMILYSSDGKNWNHININSDRVEDILYANGIFVAACGEKFFWSNDGETWSEGTKNSRDGIVEELMYGNGIFIAGGENSPVFHSFNGKEWYPGENNNFFKFEYANGIFLASSYSGGLYYSTNGTDWSQLNITTYRFNKIFHANDKFIAADYNGLYYSETFLPDAPIGVKLIEFKVANRADVDSVPLKYKAENGMNWKQFIESEYNINNDFSVSSNNMVNFKHNFLSDNWRIPSDEKIIEDHTYEGVWT